MQLRNTICLRFHYALRALHRLLRAFTTYNGTKTESTTKSRPDGPAKEAECSGRRIAQCYVLQTGSGKRQDTLYDCKMLKICRKIWFAWHEFLHHTSVTTNFQFLTKILKMLFTIWFGTPSAGCEDSNVYCGVWALRNFCRTAPQMMWMRQNCRKSCKMCWSFCTNSHQLKPIWSFSDPADPIYFTF